MFASGARLYLTNLCETFEHKLSGDHFFLRDVQFNYYRGYLQAYLARVVLRRMEKPAIL